MARGHLDCRAVRRHSWTVSTLAAAGHAGQRGPPWGPTRVPALRWAAGALGPLPDPSTGIINALAAPLSAGGFSRPSRQSEPDAVARGDPSLPAGEADRGHLLRGLGRADGYQQDKLPRRTQGQPQGRRAFPGQRLFRARRGGSKVLPRSPTSAPDDGRGQGQRNGAAAVTGAPALHWPSPVRSTPGTLGLPACPERPQNSAASGSVHTPQCAQTFRESVRVPHRPP